MNRAVLMRDVREKISNRRYGRPVFIRCYGIGDIIKPGKSQKTRKVLPKGLSLAKIPIDYIFTFFKDN